jgi:hypothetical protein
VSPPTLGALGSLAASSELVSNVVTLPVSTVRLRVSDHPAGDPVEKNRRAEREISLTESETGTRFRAPLNGKHRRRFFPSVLEN